MNTVWQASGAIARPPVPVLKVSHVVAEVTFLHAIPILCIGTVAHHLSNIQAEIIALCHAIVQPHQVIVVLNDISVEVIVGHEFLCNNSNITDLVADWTDPVPVSKVAHAELTEGQLQH